jgi:hypothetical protein
MFAQLNGESYGRGDGNDRKKQRESAPNSHGGRSGLKS